MTKLPLSVIQNIPSGDSCRDSYLHNTCPYWARDTRDEGYCVLLGVGDATAYTNTRLGYYEKACGINK